MIAIMGLNSKKRRKMMMIILRVNKITTKLMRKREKKVIKVWKI